MEQRVLFFKGLQKQFFDKVKYNLMVSSLRSILQFGLDTPYSTLKKYYNESFLLPRSLFEDLCRIAKINPQSLNVKYVESNWGQIIGGKKGIKVVQEKYPEEIKIWRKKAMLNSPVIGKGLNLKKVKLPELNENLAEFIGAYLGDGTITPYQIRIAGDYRYDIPYYRYLSKIIFDLFGIYPSFQKDKRDNNVALLVISSKTICSYLKDKFNRARPYQLAREMGLNLYPVIRTDANSASYPSGHSMDFLIILYHFGKLKPESIKILNNFYQKIKNVRELSGVHYPSDRKVSEYIFKQLVKNKLLK